MNAPTRITLARIFLLAGLLLAFFVMALVPDLVVPNVGGSKVNWAYLAFAIVFVVAASTDWLDGYLARKNNQVTELGKFLDPIADKALVDSLLVFILIPQAYAPDQLPKDKAALTLLALGVILMIARDLAVDTIRLVAARKGKVIAANMFGKAKTVLQMVAIPALLLNDWPFGYIYQSLPAWPEALHFSNVIFYSAVIMSLISGIIYLVRNRGVLKEAKQ